jgi:phosphatidylglycerophosphate synthase
MSAPRTDEDPAKAYIALTQNFADRLWRYPICHAVVGPFVRTPLTPNHVTVGHTLVAFAAAGLLLRGDPWLSLLAGALLEVRAIADCFDGVLARAKKVSSPYGRALDQLGDTLGFTAVMVVAAVVISRQRGAAVGWGVAMLNGFLSAVATTCWDFYRRRVISLLERGRDEVEDEYVQVGALLAKTPTLAMRWSWFVANFQMTFYAPSSIPRLRARIARGDVATLAEGEAPTEAALRLRERVRANDPELRAALTRVGFTGADAVFLIVCASALINDLLAGLLAGTVYAVASTLLTATACNRALSAERAEPQTA